MMPLPSSLFILPAAFLADLLLGDPENLPHPVRWMGTAIERLEPRFRRLPLPTTACGLLFALGLASGTWVLTGLLLRLAQILHPMLKVGLEAVCIYYCISARSLNDAAMGVSRCLEQNDLNAAKAKVARIVGRDVANYRAEDVARAAVETVAENSVDGVLAPFFFAAIGGAPLAMTYKMINTLDSMVGYKDDQYLLFGKGSARLDDIFNYLPARLAIPVIALASQLLSAKGARAWQTALREGTNHASPNAGLPEAAFAGALAVKLNGPNFYNGHLVDKPYIGVGFGKTGIGHIKKACDLMILSSGLWLFFLCAASALIRFIF
jgi:adenosylcobinamide-phosphate synthase